MPHQSNRTDSDLLQRIRAVGQTQAEPETPQEDVLQLPSSARTDLVAAQSSTALTLPFRSPGGGEFTVDTQTGEATAERPGVLGRLRNFRDKLVNETLANNPLQEAAAPVLGAVGDVLGRTPAEEATEALAEGPISTAVTLTRAILRDSEDLDVNEASALDVVENLGKGAAVGAVLIPDDAAVDPENPNTGLLIAGVLAGAVAEGAVADLGILKGLNVLATAKRGTNVGRSAETALRLFGAGEDMSTMRRIVGGGLLGGTSEIGLQAAALRSPEEIVANAGLVAVGGAALGGAVASVAAGTRAAKSLPRAAEAFADEFSRVGETSGRSPIAAAAEKSGMFSATARTPLLEQGIGPETEYIQRVQRAIDEAAVARSIDAKPPAESVPPGRLNDEALESMFDVDSSRPFLERVREGFRAANEVFENSFRFEAEMRRFKSMTGLDELNLSDDFRVLKVSISRAPRLAEKELKNVAAPLLDFSGENFTEAFRSFERLVFLRDFLETAERGLELPKGISAETVRSELNALEATAPRQVLEAAEHHRQVVNKMREELIRRGKLDTGAGYDHYVPHVVVEDLARVDAETVGDIDPSRLNYFSSRHSRGGKLQEPTRLETRKRGGSRRQISTDYTEIMYRAIRRFHVDNAVDDFLADLNKNFGLKRKDLGDAEKKALNRVGKFTRGDETFRIFHPTGPRFFSAKSVDEESYNALRAKIKQEMDADIEDLPEVRDILAVGRRKEFILPEPVAARLDQFYAPDPLRKTVLSPLLKATSWWKRNTIWWGLSRFFMFQIAGDTTNLIRSNPAALVQIQNGRVDSPTFRAIREIFKQYGTPMMSPVQARASLVGGIGGLTINETANSDDPSVLARASSILAGAGLGYVLGTRRVAGRLRAFSEVYDDADRLGAVNSGFVFQEEELARRILGRESTNLPTRSRTPWQRGLDTMTTILSGKVQGDPSAFARVPAEIIERVQNERENVLRLASYMQQLDQGVNPRVAAKRARESLVDYGKFTDFENKFIRGFALPFYSFYRHNIPNWIKATVGRDVGGKASVAFAAVAGIAAGDVIAQAWNETFFPEVEQRLGEFRRERFHIILGNPITGEVFKDPNGRALVAGWEMPYEQALEMFGLARPGYVMSQLFGLGSEREQDVDLVERGRRTAEDLATLKPVRDFTTRLLSPVLKLPAEVVMNKDLFFNSPLVPERYVGSGEGRKRMFEHTAETLLRQIRETKRTAAELKGGRFDPLTSAFGLGLPIDRVDMDREFQGFLHERMAATAEETAEIQAPWKSRIDDIVYDRESFSRVAENEPQQVLEIIKDHTESQADQAAAWRYYMNRGAKGSLERHWNSLSSQEKVRFFNSLPEWGKTSFVYYLNGGSDIEVDGRSVGLPGFVGGGS